MKKRVLVILLVVLLLVLLVVPIPMGVYEDGGTREYTALTYKIIDWNRIIDDSVYDRVRTIWEEQCAQKK